MYLILNLNLFLIQNDLKIKSLVILYNKETWLPNKLY